MRATLHMADTQERDHNNYDQHVNEWCMMIDDLIPLGMSFLMAETQFSLSSSLCSRNMYCYKKKGTIYISTNTREV